MAPSRRRDRRLRRRHGGAGWFDRRAKNRCSGSSRTSCPITRYSRGRCRRTADGARTDDHVRTRRQSYNADAYERVERIVGEDTTRTLKQVTLQLHLKKYLIGDPGLRRAVGISNRELNVIGPALCEGDRLSTSLAPGIQLVPLEQQIANGIRLMEPSDQARLRLLLGQPMCGIYQRVCDELGWGATAGLNGSGDGSAGT
ncbi:MAG: hypothetical protein R3B96_06735 [Pirellulaceae bacterium]